MRACTCVSDAVCLLVVRVTLFSLQIIFVMTPGISSSENVDGNIVDLFLSHPLATGHLVSTLINTYIGKHSTY